MMRIVVAVLVLLGLTGLVQAAGDPTAGKEKSATCAGCHGVDGKSPTNPAWPKLAGQNADYIIKQLSDFKSGARKNPTMAPMAAPLSEQDMADLATYYASQPVQVGAASEALAAKGQKLYRGGDMASSVPACASCHGPAGAGNPAAKFPLLSGQQAAYTSTQLNAFKSGERANDAGRMMRNIASKMGEDEIKAVSDYIAGLH